jgi:hypothetical protein
MLISYGKELGMNDSNDNSISNETNRLTTIPHRYSTIYSTTYEHQPIPPTLTSLPFGYIPNTMHICNPKTEQRQDSARHRGKFLE